MKKRLPWIFAFAFLFGVEPTCAYAYLDPGTGSVLLQSIIAGIAGSLFAIRTYWTRIVRFFRAERSEQTDASERARKDHA